MLLRLLTIRQLETRWIGDGVRCVPTLLLFWGRGVGNSWSGLGDLGWEAMVKVYGVAMARPQGYSRVPHPLTGQQ